MKNQESAIMIAAIAATMISFPVAIGLMFQVHEAQAYQHRTYRLMAPVAVSGNNIYTAWNNASATLHGDAVSLH
jgi:hypothetical protein